MDDDQGREADTVDDDAFVDAGELVNFARLVLTEAGADPAEAGVVAEALVWADRVERSTQGVWRLDVLTRRLEAGLFRSPCDLVIEPLSDAAALIDGRNGLGHFVADRGMRHAMHLAERSAVAVVGVRNGNYLGAAGYYAQMAANEGMIGIALSNSFPKVAAHNGEKPVLGTNPLAFAAPRGHGRPILLDMATSSSSGSALRWRAETSEQVAEGSSSEGEPAIAKPSDSEVIRPLGGAKGFGLGLMVEVLAGAMTGAGVSHDVRSMYHDFDLPGNNGHLFLALRLEAFTPGDEYGEKIEGLIESIASSGSPSPEGPALPEPRVPGQSRWEALDRSEEAGIRISARVRQDLERLGETFGGTVRWK